MTKPEHQIADALRLVALRLEAAIEAGHRSTRIDANDLQETLLAIADELDPVESQDLVNTANQETAQ